MCWDELQSFKLSVTFIASTGAAMRLLTNKSELLLKEFNLHTFEGLEI